jgi:hypothetical protein
MGTRYTSRYCSHCKDNVLALESTPSHGIHLFLTIVTLGMWIPIWIVATICSFGSMRCSKCGMPL